MKGMKLVVVDAEERVLMVMNKAEFHSLVHGATQYQMLEILDGPGLFVGSWGIICQYFTEGLWKELF